MTSHRRNDNRGIPNIAGSSKARPRHSTGYAVRHGLRAALVSVLLAVLAFAGTAAAAVWNDLYRTIEDGRVDVVAQDGNGDDENALIDPNAGQTIEFLVLGQDTRDGEANSAIGGGDEMGSLHNADTTMVVQIAADRSYINLVSIPRDSMVSVPSCTTSNGTIPAQSYVQFNSIFANAYAVGGDLASAASCTMSAVNSLTGLNLQNFIVVDFQGLSEMIDALGGVDLCIPEDISDPYTGLNIARGLRHLDGTQATQYARTRYSLGDGSDVMRTTRQQYLIKTLLNQALSKNLLTESGQLYQMARAALSSLNISTGMADVATLAGLAMSLSGMSASNFYTQTVPVAADPYDINRVVWAYSADDMWARLVNQQPLVDQPAEAPASDDGAADDGTAGDAAAGDAGEDGAASAGEGTDGDGTDGTAQAAATPDPTTGLITQTDPYTGATTLIDPSTGGVVDPDSGTIQDPVTGQYLGVADQYLYATVCAVPAQE